MGCIEVEKGDGCNNRAVAAVLIDEMFGENADIIRIATFPCQIGQAAWQQFYCCNYNTVASASGGDVFGEYASCSWVAGTSSQEGGIQGSKVYRFDYGTVTSEYVGQNRFKYPNLSRVAGTCAEISCVFFQQGYLGYDHTVASFGGKELLHKSAGCRRVAISFKQQGRIRKGEGYRPNYGAVTAVLIGQVFGKHPDIGRNTGFVEQVGDVRRQ